MQDVVEQLTELRAIMRKNYENGAVDKIPQQRWCSGDSPFLFKERWEKIFEDWVGVKQEKFDPSRVSELYDSVCGLVVTSQPRRVVSSYPSAQIRCTAQPDVPVQHFRLQRQGRRHQRRGGAARST